MRRLAAVAVIGFWALSAPWNGCAYAQTADSLRSIEDMFKASDVAFGIVADGYFYSDPMYYARVPDTWKGSDLSRLRPLATKTHQLFYRYPDHRLPECIMADLGDTVSVIWSQGSCRATIKCAGFGTPSCEEDDFYLLQPIDCRAPSPSYWSAGLILREHVQLQEPVIPFQEHVPDSPYFHALRDSVLQIVADSNAGELRSAYVRFYGVRSDTLPNELFMSVHGMTGATEWHWSAVYLVERTDIGWSSSCALDLHKGWYRFDVEATFDLDGDGHREILVNHGPAEALYTLVNGKLMPVARSKYHGC